MTHLEERVTQIGRALKAHVFDKLVTPRLSVFLCGKGTHDKSSIRAEVAKQILRGLWWHKVQIIYPEDLFEELLSGHRSLSLLELENQLASSVDAIVLIPECPGAFAELGAFANHNELSKRLICLQEQRFRRKRSFVNYGPIRQLQRIKRYQVVYVDRALPNPSYEKLFDSIRKVAKENHRPVTDITFTNIDSFLLPSLFVTGPISRATLVTLVKHADPKSGFSAETLVAAGLSILRKRGLLTRTPSAFDVSAEELRIDVDGYQLSDQGIASFHRLNRRGAGGRFVYSEVLDELRMQTLHLTHRKALA